MRPAGRTFSDGFRIPAIRQSACKGARMRRAAALEGFHHLVVQRLRSPSSKRPPPTPAQPAGHVCREAESGEPRPRRPTLGRRQAVQAPRKGTGLPARAHHRNVPPTLGCGIEIGSRLCSRRRYELSVLDSVTTHMAHPRNRSGPGRTEWHGSAFQLTHPIRTAQGLRSVCNFPVRVSNAQTGTDE